MTITKGTFVEINFTGKIADTNEVFDTTIVEVAKSSNIETKNLKPFILSVGHLMLPKGFDADLLGKEAGKEYVLALNPEEAFGKRDPKLVQMIPTKHFHEQKIEPVRGMHLDLDGQITKVLSSSGGRTLIDFNNPLAGKKVEYTYTILRVIEDQKEKIDSLQEFLFQRKFEFEITGKKVLFTVSQGFEAVVKMLAPKFKEILDLEIEAKLGEVKTLETKKPVEEHVHGPDCDHDHD